MPWIWPLPSGPPPINLYVKNKRNQVASYHTSKYNTIPSFREASFHILPILSLRAGTKPRLLYAAAKHPCHYNTIIMKSARCLPVRYALDNYIARLKKKKKKTRACPHTQSMFYVPRRSVKGIKHSIRSFPQPLQFTVSACTNIIGSTYTQTPPMQLREYTHTLVNANTDMSE